MLDKDTIKSIAFRAIAERARGQNDINNVTSPCISVCKMDDTSGLCQGCLRSLDEIARWGRADAAYKRLVWAKIEQRAAQLA